MTPFVQNLWVSFFASSMMLYRHNNRSANIADQLGLAMNDADCALGEWQKTGMGDPFALSAYQPPKGVVELATQLREKILSSIENTHSPVFWKADLDHHSVMQLLDLIIGTPDDGQQAPSTPPHQSTPPDR